MKQLHHRLLRYLACAALALAAMCVFAFSCAFVYLAPSLPTAAGMRNVEVQVPLRVYTRTGELIAQIGEQRRIPVTFEEIPELVRRAVLAAEDDRFFQHHGIDWTGVLRAVAVNLTSADRAQGASTITMQAARNMFLTLDKTYRRKLSEVFVTFRMERAFSKEEILRTYLNRIFFGQRSYGIAAAAETFYGKHLADLSVAEAATLAGIIQLPSRYNPVASPALAQTRRNYVLRRMTELGYIDAQVAEQARQEPITSRGFAPLYDVEAPFVAEMARQEILQRYGPAAVNAGYQVYTTLDGRLQTAANRALRLGLIEYDRRHGYRGPVAQVPQAATGSQAQIEAAVEQYPVVGNLYPALVVSVAPNSARVFVRASGYAQVEWDGLSWARRLKGARQGPAPKQAAEVVARGDIVYVVTDRRGAAQLAQLPQVQGALVGLDPNNGAIAALVGGFDYFNNKFNHVTQARRQPGSGFKPFLYSAALESGMTPASIVMDTPVVEDDVNIEGAWRPKNSGGEFLGPMRLREALVRSRNMVSIRILRSLGIRNVIDYATRFGFPAADLPQNLTLALGTLQATPLELATGYAVFANGGFRVEPHLFDRIVSATGEELWRAEPKTVCQSCETTAAPQLLIPAADTDDPCVAPADYLRASTDLARVAERVITAQNDWLMTDIMGDVIKRGTGQRARMLGRSDIGGKTGTTDENKDAWFNGFNRNLVATVWVGYDQARSLGDLEEGSSTAVPIWVHFMREALRGTPQRERPMPDGLVSLRISPQTGALADALDPGAIFETFMIDRLPVGAQASPEADGTLSPPPGSQGAPSPSSEPLF